eukprot:TRINITY_DN460_c0_g1_i1.p1 TRINITY_DN460_c0_g1~~TRINITY_DN460_c0_g1_i1.p1  ORF type:complete len:129 (+),score=32.67 TRINITY_DN460_c0_g1_i1:65-451(+)
MIRRPPRSTQSRSSAASDVYKRQVSTQSTGQTAPRENSTYLPLRCGVHRSGDADLRDTDWLTDLTGSRNLIGQLAPASSNAKAPRSELRGPSYGTEFGAMFPRKTQLLSFAPVSALSLIHISEPTRPY